MDLDLDDQRIRWIPAWLARRMGLVGRYTGLEDEHPGDVPVPAEAIRGPRACAAGVTLPPVRPLDVGAADRARIVLGLGGEWPSPVPGQYSEDES